MTTYEGNILESVSHYHKIKFLLLGRQDKEAIEMIAHCDEAIEEWEKAETEFWGEEEESAPPQFIDIKLRLIKEEELD